MNITETLELPIVFGSLMLSIIILVIIDRIGTIRELEEEEEDI